MGTSRASQIIDVIRAVTTRDGALPLHEPALGHDEIEHVVECVRSGWVSSVGKFVEQFEASLAEYHGVARAVAVVNGTAALHASLLLSGVGSGDEVLLPALTFVATANAVAYCGASPHFIDTDPRTLGIDVSALEAYLAANTRWNGKSLLNTRTGAPIKAIVPVHIFGIPVDMDPLMKLAQEYHLLVIEDAAESLGSLYRGRKTGTFGLLAALSFNGNKIITTGGGGAILTNDAAMGAAAKHITTTARQPHPWEYFHDRVGFNYRMPNINAALGVAQLKKVDEFIQMKRRLRDAYQKSFSSVPGVSFIQEPEYSRSNCWLNAIRVPADERDFILSECASQGIACRPIWRLLSDLPMFRGCPRMSLTGATELERTTINIPSSAGLGTVG